MPCVLLPVSGGAQEPGSVAPHQPLICIDEGHNNRFTLQGRFAMAAEIWRGDRKDVRSTKARFSADSLEQCDVLVIANALHQRNVVDWSLPTPSAFEPEEIEAVVDWITAGGRLLLFADHMPMPGAARDLAAAIGVRFTNSFAVNPTDMSGTLTFRRADGGVQPHPIMDAVGPPIDSVTTYTGQAFLAGPGFQPLLVIPDGIVALLPQVAWQFPHGTPQIPVSGWLQGAAATIGEGRVVVFGEAAQFRPTAESGGPRAENERLILNVMRWLAEGTNPKRRTPIGHRR